MDRMTNDKYSARVIHGDYYPHIDGIRALAVLPVVLFHVLSALCPGGFAGVDVFFVISGYLITGGILRDLATGRFTIRNFYHRRIRRIMPAYFTLIAGVWAVGCVLYYSRPLVHLSNTVIMATLFSANLYFCQISGAYFSPNIHDYPLLHLWSLSVEEQFYLCIPLLCVILWKLRRPRIAPVMATLAVLSLAAAIYALRLGKMNSVFYLLHYRAWELLAGALLAMLPVASSSAYARLDAGPAQDCRKRFLFASVNARHALLASLGMLLVLLPYACLSSQTPFPGITAAPSVLGAVLLIRYGHRDWVARLLSWRPFVLTGKISYSLYLWHWPVTVFWKYAVYNQLCVYDYLGMFLLSLLLGYLSWRFVEVPVRTSPAWTMRRTFAFSATGIMLLVAVGTACTCANGWPNRLHVEANRMASNELPSLALQRVVGAGIRISSAFGYRMESPYRACFGTSGDLDLGLPGKQPKLLLVGDSHAWNLQYGLAISLQARNQAGYAITRPNSVMFNIHDENGRHVLAELAKRPQVSEVILASRWIDYVNLGTKPSIPSQPWNLQLEEFAMQVQSMHRRLFIVADTPSYDYAPSDIAARMKIIAPRQLEPGWADPTQSERDYDRMQGDINCALENVCQKTGAVYIPVHLALKHGERYIAFETRNGCAVPLYGDGNHLTHAGSLRAAQFIMSCLVPQAPSARTQP